MTLASWLEGWLLWPSGAAPGPVLNDRPKAPGTPVGVEAAQALRQAANALKGEAFDPASGRMNYARLASSQAYRQYCGLAAGLQALDPNALQGQAERTAFWLNLYNALMVDAVIQLGVRTSVKAGPGLFWRVAYRIGGLRFSLTDIEHGILRANAGHPAIPGAHFAASDPRRRLCLPVIDPRIHFALNCASRSCPPIAWYRGDRLSIELDQAAASFLESGGMQFNIDRGIVWLSQLFRWYEADFGGRILAVGSRQPLLDFVARYQLVGPVREFLTTGQPRVRFLSYDWSLNRWAGGRPSERAGSKAAQPKGIRPGSHTLSQDAVL